MDFEMTEAPVLEIEDLQTYFFTYEGVAKAVDDVGFSVKGGEILGLVGESGSGKTVTGFSILQLVDPPGKIVGGRIQYKGEDLLKADERRMRQLRGDRIAMVFQDPMMTLNPVLRIDTQIIDAIKAHSELSGRPAYERARDALGQVGIPSPEERMKAYPHQFSGGMRQRVVIAIALLHGPDLLIADEPTTALDVTIQGQILSLVKKLCRERRAALMWITHDLAVVAGLADRLCVMYGGKIVETGTVDEILDTPLHPYTQGLIRSIPDNNPMGSRLAQINGMTPSLLQLPTGCPFRPRCTAADDLCLNSPKMITLESGREVRCFHSGAPEAT